MTPDRLKHIQTLFDQALSVPPPERSTFLDNACASDKELRAHLESLIQQHNRTGSSLLEAGFGDHADEQRLRTPSKTFDLGGAVTAVVDFNVPPGSLINDRYLLRQELGRGGFGIVYLASDQQLRSKPVVVKIVLQKEIDIWARQQFSAEVEALARLNHPGIVSILDAGEALDGRPFLVMEYVDGVVLRSLMRSGGIDLNFASEILRQVAGALEAAHASGIWHRDLKPENIMVQTLVGGERRAKLIDFGIAVIRGSEKPIDAMTRVAGSFRYMAPEQLTGKPSAASDNYALGVLAYELFTGRIPFNAETPVELYGMQINGKYRSARALRPDLPERAEQAIARALSFAEDVRYPSPLAFANDIMAAIGAYEVNRRGSLLEDTTPSLGRLAPRCVIADHRRMILNGLSRSARKKMRDVPEYASYPGWKEHATKVSSSAFHTNWNFEHADRARKMFHQYALRESRGNMKDRLRLDFNGWLGGYLSNWRQLRA